MTADAVKTTLSRAVKATWPNVTKASELPFPEYWRGVTEWLTFHASHVSDGFMRELITGYIMRAVEAEHKGEKPDVPTVPEKVRAIWHRAEGREDRAEKRRRDAWNNAAERAADVRNRFSVQERRLF